ncbi:MAG: anthranilate phosphoribosyltransferase [Bacteroidales bacterium]
MKEELYRLFEHQYLSRKEAHDILLNIAEGRFNDNQIAAFITVFLMRSISVEELAGFREALLETSLSLDFSEYTPIDIVGTGGDNKNTFNISTAAAFVVAGAGYKVVKHGNYGASTLSGASNVMEQHGVKFSDNAEHLRRSLDQANMAYLHAPLFNPALKKVAGVRKALGVRTFFNMLGPLVNPVKPKHQLLGVYNLKLARLYAYTFQQTGTAFVVVHSLDGYDEISLTGDFKVVSNKGEELYTPEMIGLSRCTHDDLWGGDTLQAAAQIFDAVLGGTATRAQTECVIANAAFAIRTLMPHHSLEQCLAEARESIESGRALQRLKLFIDCNS